MIARSIFALLALVSSCTPTASDPDPVSEGGIGDALVIERTP